MATTNSEGYLFSPEEFEAKENKVSKKRGRRPKPNILEPRPNLTMEEMREKLAKLSEIETTLGIKYVQLRLTAKMIIGVRESSGKEFTINLNDLYRAYQNCPRFTSPVVKKYIFMGHSPAVALLRMLQHK